MWRYSILCIVLLSIYSSCGTKEGITNAISYNTHIRPILSDKCFKCHGPDENKRISGYRLDTEEGALAMLKDNLNQFGIVPGHPDKSDVYARIISTDPEFMMPPPEENLALTQEEITLIHNWIKQGAPYEPHWSFVPLKPTKLPSLDDPWVRNEIDAFTLQKMHDKKLKPSPEEDKQILLKRVMHDLTGLPPSIQQQDAFLANVSAHAYERVVDEALASPFYGEKMAILWMDIARYADSHGYQDDGLRTMWPWRDWVIHAFNKNYSYEQFVTWQLAGDLIPNHTREMILATGFNRNHKITQEGGVIDEEYRIEYVADRTNTFGKALLGMTFECAKCHDHKYDPISQEDYFGVFAFFNQVPEKGLYGDITLASLADPPYMQISCEDREGILNFLSKLDTSDVRVMIMKDSNELRPTHILNRGLYDQKGRVVHHRTPKAILPFDTIKFQKNRYGLAKWMFDRKNPLTARVFVNAIWQQFFGRGLVKTSGDFGLQGELPSHPELLDWLAYDFMQNGWNIKRLVKQIVLSATYRQSTRQDEKLRRMDPENKYLSRGPRQALSAELLNDHVLASSGLLVNHIGGPSVKPYQPNGLWEAATSGRGQLATYVQDRGNSLYRRGLYHFIKRTVPPPAMLIFDASNRDQCEVSRTNTNTPLQALVMLNDLRILEASKFLAASLIQGEKDAENRLIHAFRRVLCRQPKKQEMQVLRDYYANQLNSITKEKAKKLLDVGEKEVEINAPVETVALMQAIHVLYNLEETSMR